MQLLLNICIHIEKNIFLTVLLHCRKESVSVPEGGAWPPQAEPRGVAQIFRLGRSGRGDIDDPGARQRDLQPDAGKALFGPLGRAKLGLSAGRVPECMRFVEQDDAVEVWPAQSSNCCRRDARSCR